jgi:hypothetical protein
MRPWVCRVCRLVNWPNLDGTRRTSCHGCKAPG